MRAPAFQDMLLITGVKRPGESRRRSEYEGIGIAKQKLST